MGDAGTPSDGIVNAHDVAALVDPLQEPSRCDVHGNNPSQGLILDIDALIIATVVNAFKQYDYPYSGPAMPGPCPP